jgi:hypothetical protein
VSVEADHAACSSKRDQIHVAVITWFEANGRTGWNIKPLTACSVTVKDQSSISFLEMEVGPHLDGAVTAVGNAEGCDLPIGIEFKFAGFRDQFTGDQGCHQRKP